MANRKKKWFGLVRWCDDDIAEKLREMDIDPTPAHIAAVRSLCEDGHCLEDTMIEAGWNTIEYLIDELMEDGKIIQSKGE